MPRLNQSNPRGLRLLAVAAVIFAALTLAPTGNVGTAASTLSDFSPRARSCWKAAS